MTTSETNTSNVRNLAQLLQKSGQKSNIISVAARGIRETVQTYLGMPVNPSPSLQEALNQVNSEIATITAGKDSALKEQPTQEAVPSNLAMGQVGTIGNGNQLSGNDSLPFERTGS